MTTPPSIRRFALFWWAATAAWLLGTMLAWKRTQATLAANPQTAAAADIAQPITVAIVLGVTALLWWLVVRRASPIGKWLSVAIAACSAMTEVFRLAGVANDASWHPLSLVSLLVGSVLTVAAAIALFRPDAAAWFGISELEEQP